MEQGAQLVLGCIVLRLQIFQSSADRNQCIFDLMVLSPSRSVLQGSELGRRARARAEPADLGSLQRLLGRVGSGYPEFASVSGRSHLAQVLLELVQALLYQSVMRILFGLKLGNRGLHLAEVRFYFPVQGLDRDSLRVIQALDLLRQLHYFLF